MGFEGVKSSPHFVMLKVVRVNEHAERENSFGECVYKSSQSFMLISRASAATGAEYQPTNSCDSNASNAKKG